MSKLVEEFVFSVAGGFGGIWINSYEQYDVFSDLSRECLRRGWRLFSWDPPAGLIELKPAPKQHGVSTGAITALPTGKSEIQDSLQYVMALGQNNEDEDDPDNRVVVIFRNATRFFATADGKVEAPGTLHTLQESIEKGSSSKKHIVVMSYDHITPPPELIKLLRVIDEGPPDSEERWQLISGVNPDLLPDRKSSEAQHLLDASAGLGRQEILGAFGMSVSKTGKFLAKEIWDFKAQCLAKEGILEVMRTPMLPEEAKVARKGFESIGGLTQLKKFLTNVFQNRHHSVKPRGALLVGPPGNGKTAIAVALGEEINRQVIRLDVSKLMGGIIGATEANTRRALAAIDAAAPAIAVIDELDKSLSGSGGSGEHDSGVGRRMFGSLLTWMNDHTSDIFLVATANDIRNLPPELYRAGRMDAIFFVDLPNPDQRRMIWDLYVDLYVKLGLNRDFTKQRPDDENWTPAEIKTCCRQSLLQNIPLVEAAAFITPIYKSGKASIDNLREWATGRVLSADYLGMYDPNSKATTIAMNDTVRRRAVRNIEAKA